MGVDYRANYGIGVKLVNIDFNEDDEIDYNHQKRLVFKFGDDEQSVKDKLYERDFVLEFEKKVVYET